MSCAHDRIEDGSFRYWAGGVESVDFVSVYALHVLLEAERARRRPCRPICWPRGQAVPDPLARRDGDNLADERTSALRHLSARPTGHGRVERGGCTAAAPRQPLCARTWQADIVAAYLAARLSADAAGSARQPQASPVSLWWQSHDARSLARTRWPRCHAALPAGATFPEPAGAPAGHGARHAGHARQARRVRLAVGGNDHPGARCVRKRLSPNGTPHSCAIEATLAAVSDAGADPAAGLFPQRTSHPDTRIAEIRAAMSPDAASYLVNQSGFDRAPTTQTVERGTGDHARVPDAPTASPLTRSRSAMRSRCT